MISRTQIENFNKKFDVVSAFIDHGPQTLLLLRQDHKPQGNTWAMVAGKVDEGESLEQALAREVAEEIDLHVKPEEFKFHESYFVRYPGYDYLYHVFHLSLLARPVIRLNKEEHKELQWVEPREALKLKLIQYEDVCIKSFYNLD
jgi:8-oxo-dGTP pyrophosphatase MutT (NUDIX family)